MKLRTILLILFVFGPVTVPKTLFANEVQLSASEIKALLSGNTAKGTWFGGHYRQFFESRGYTKYKPVDGPLEEGKWRVNTKTGNYESWWERSGWSNYKIVRINGQLHWKGANTEPQPFEMLPGNQLKD